MFEQWYARLTGMMETHPGLHRLAAALLAALSAGAALWRCAGRLARRAAPCVRAFGGELAALGREAAEHLRETGTMLAGLARRLMGLYRAHWLPLVMTKGRAVFHTARQWTPERIPAVREAAPLCRARPVRAAGISARRATALGLTLCMVLSLLPVSALGADAPACSHVHDDNCGYVETPCDKGCADTNGDGAAGHAPDCGHVPATGGASCAHVHDGDCGGLPSETAEESAACETCGGEHAPAVCPVEHVRGLMSALPDPAEAAARMADENADWDQIAAWAAQAQTAQDAYDALTPEQQALLPEAQEIFAALTSAFRGDAATLASTSGTSESDPIIISDKYQLEAFRDRVNSGDNQIYGKLTDDINLGNEDWTPIGYYILMSAKDLYPFKGGFDGNGYTISGLNVSCGNAGLFGTIAKGGVVKNLAVEGAVYVNYGTYSDGGGIAGVNHGTIEGCINLADITNKAGANSETPCLGGIVGNCKYDGIIKNCYNGGSVTGVGFTYAGGIVGSLGGEARQCFNTGTVTGGFGDADDPGKGVGSISGTEFNDDASELIDCYYLKGSITGAGYGQSTLTALTLEQMTGPNAMGTGNMEDLNYDNKHPTSFKWLAGDYAGQVPMGEVFNGKRAYYSPVHSHRACGNYVCSHSGHSGNITYEIWDGTSVALSAGNYYLKNNVTLSGDLTITGEVNLCLNGKTLTLGAGSIKPEANAVLNLCDCGKNGKVTSTGSTVSFTNASAQVNLYGGTVAGTSGADTVTDTAEGCAFTLYGGAVSNTNLGCAIKANRLTVTLWAGTVSAHSEDGVALTEDSKLNLWGSAAITGGAYDGASIRTPGTGRIDMNGHTGPAVTIKFTKANPQDGDIVVTHGTTKMAKLYSDYSTDPNQTLRQDADGNLLYHLHNYTYAASGTVITERCTCGHEETATLKLDGGPYYYTGSPVTPAKVGYTSGWLGGDLTVGYQNNTAPGTAAASITKDNATASLNFTIAAGCTVKYHLNGVYASKYATSGLSTKFIAQVAQGATLTAPPEPIADDYEFAGWYKTAACADGQKWDFTADTVTSNETILYAKWTPKPAIAPTITKQPQSLDLAYGAGGSLRVTVGDTPYSHTRSIQWYQNTQNSTSGGTPISGATDPWYDISEKVASGTYYYYCVITYTRDETKLAASATSDVAVVTISKGGQTAPAENEGYAISCADETITVTESYEVYTAQTGGTKVESGGQITPGATYYIRKTETGTQAPSDWTAITVPPRPAAPGGAVAVTDETIKGRKDGKITIPAGMEYQAQSGNWFSDKTEMRGLTGNDQVKIRVSATADAFHGEEQTYTVNAGRTLSVTFDANGGSPAPNQITGLSYQEKITAPEEPARPGYTFEGWYLQNVAKWDFEQNLVADDITLAARWTPGSYTVTFDLNGEDAAVSPVSMLVAYGGTYGTLPTPAGAEKKFVGWFTAADGGAEVKTGDTVTITGNAVLYAHWTEKVAITLDLTGQTVPYSGAAQSFQLRGADSGLTGFAVAYARNGTAVTGPADAGVYTVTITRPADGDHQPYSAATTLSITRKPLAEAMLTVTGEYTYDGTKQTIQYTVDDGGALKAADYTAEVTGNQDAGTDTGRITVTATESGNYSGTISKAFSIAPRPYGDGKGFSIADIPDQSYSGAAVTPEPEVRYGETMLVKGTDFTYTYQNNIEVGTAAIQISFQGNFSGTASRAFSIQNAVLPDGISQDDIFAITGAELMTWHRDNITLSAKDGWTVGTAPDALGVSVTLSGESARNAQGEIVPSSAALYVKTGNTIYVTTVTYLLDKTAPTVSYRSGNPSAWTNQNAEITFVTDDGLSGVADVQVTRDGTVDYPVRENSFTADQNGAYLIAVTDKAGNTGTVAVAVEKIDKTNPAVALTPGGTMGENGWYTSAVTVAVSIEEAHPGRWEYTLDGETWTPGTADGFTLSASGDYTGKIGVRAVDLAGNTGEAELPDIRVDREKTAAPAVSALSGGKAYQSGQWTAQDVVFTLSGDPTASGHQKYQYSVDGGAWRDVTGNPPTHSGMAAGETAVYRFRAVNNAGTPGAESAEFTVRYRRLSDGAADSPENKYSEADVTISADGGQGGWHTADVTVTVEKKTVIADGGKRYDADTYYQVDGGGSVKLEGTEILLTADGVHTLELWTRDEAGNETTRLELTVRIDKAGPVIKVDSLVESWTAERDYTFGVADALSGVSYLSIVGERETEPTVLEVRADGRYTHRVRANDTYTITTSDTAGNSSSVFFTVQKIDTAAPTAAFGAIEGEEGTNGWFTGKVTVEVLLDDPETTRDDPDTSAVNESDKSGLRGWQYSLDGGETWSAEQGPKAAAFTISADGDYSGKVKLRAFDNAGNRSGEATASVKLDQTRPVPALRGSAGGAGYDGTEWTAEDVVLTPSNTAENPSGAVFYCYDEKTDTWTALTDGSFTVDWNCDATFRFKAISGAGLESEERRAAVRRSRITPAELAETEYGQDDVAAAPDRTGEWYTSAPTVTVEKKPTVGTGGLPATTYYELWKAPAESGVKTELTGSTIRPEGDGEWTLKLWTGDAAGNETEPYVATLLVDTTAPVVSYVSGNPAVWTSQDAAIIFTAADATSGVAGVAVLRDGAAAYPAETGSFTADRNGTYTVAVTDRAGNAASMEVEVSKIDKTAPAIAWDAATDGLDAAKWYGKTRLGVAASDDSGEAPAVTYTANGLPLAGGLLDRSGVFTVTATAVDGAGNRSSVGRSLRIETRIDDFVDMVDRLDQSSPAADVTQAKDWYDALTGAEKDRLSKNGDAAAAREKLDRLVEQKAGEIAESVAEDIRSADTVEEILSAKDRFDHLAEDAKNRVSDEDRETLRRKVEDAEAARKAAEQLAAADRPGASYEEKTAAREAYDKLTGERKDLADKVSGTEEYYKSVCADLSAIDAVLDLLEKIRRPYTPADKDRIEAAGEAYDKLKPQQKNAFPGVERDRLDVLEAMRGKAQAVEDGMKALGSPPAQEALRKAKADYATLTADEKNMVDGALKDSLEQKYKEMLDGLTADEKAAAEFAVRVEETKNAPTVEKIEQLIKDHDALSGPAEAHLSQSTRDDYRKLADDLEKAREVIDKLDGIDLDQLTPEVMEKVQDALGKGDADGYDDLTEDQKKLVDEATDGKPGILKEATAGVEEVVDKIEHIPGHGGGSTKPDGSPDLDDCVNPDNSNADNSASGGHSYEDHKTAIEQAKLAYEKLTDAARRLISAAAVEKLNLEYAALMAYLEYVNTASTAGASVEVVGLAEKVALPADSVMAPKTVVCVVMEESRSAATPPAPAGKTEALSVDVKLVADIYGAADDEIPVAREPVQPKENERVLVKLKVPSGYRNDTLEIWHVKDNGARSRISDFWLVTEADGAYAVFEVSSFSHFVLFAQSVYSGGEGTTPPKPSISDSDHGSAAVSPARPRPGDTVTITPAPDEGYEVGGVVVTDQGGRQVSVNDNADGTWTFIQPEGRVTISVTFRPAWPFTDVTQGDWCYESVRYVYGKGLMLGTADDRFSPYLTASRGMVVTILWRLEGENTPAGTVFFDDVAEGQYYTDAVAWAAGTDIVKGYDNGCFGPEDPVTREQLAAILYRYTRYRGGDTAAAGDLSRFADQPSDWAAEAVRWAAGAGIITGKGGGSLDPRGAATRAETAQMLRGLLD